MQELFEISPEETMAFGDNTNDLGLMEAAGESYAVRKCPSARQTGCASQLSAVAGKGCMAGCEAAVAGLLKNTHKIYGQM